MLGFEGENAREKVIVLLTMCFALAMAMLDNTVVNVALPRIQQDLNAGFSELQWVVDAYVLAFASLLLTGGILGDRYGRKKMFLGGLAVFTFFSFACGLASTPQQLIVARALQGVGGALLIPGTVCPGSRWRSDRPWAATWSSTSAGRRCSSSTCRSASSPSSSRPSPCGNRGRSRSASSTSSGSCSGRRRCSP
jgi:MFS family permease